MDQPALDRWLGTVGANPPCCFRTATHLVTHSSNIYPETPATSRFNRHSPDKGGRLRSLLFFTLQPHRPKTRHQKWPSETESRNDAFVARSGTRRLSLIRRVGPICADFGGPPANNGGDRTFESSDSRDPAEFWPQRLFAFEVRRGDTQLGPSAKISAGVLTRTLVAAGYSGHTGSRDSGRHRKADERRSGRASFGGTSEPIRRLRYCGAPGRARRW